MKLELSPTTAIDDPELDRVREILAPWHHLHWESIRSLVLGNFLEAHVAALRADLERLRSGLPVELDNLAPVIKSAKKILGNLPAESRLADQARLIVSYLYWAHSKDVGAAAALSRTSVERQFGNLCLWEVKPCPMELACPCCGAMCATQISSVCGDPMDYAVRFGITCNSCGHVERAQHERPKPEELSVLLCECSMCTQRRAQIAASLQSLAAGVAGRFSGRVRREIVALSAFMRAPAKPDTPSRGAKLFCTKALERPDLSPWEILNTVVRQLTGREVLFPHSRLQQIWELVLELHACGVAMLTELEHADLDDDAALLHATLCSKAGDDEEKQKRKEQQRSAAVTILLKGVRRDASGRDLMGYVRALDQGGFGEWHFLPCLCTWLLNEQEMARVAEVQQITNQPFKSTKLYLYPRIPAQLSCFYYEDKVRGLRDPLLKLFGAPALQESQTALEKACGAIAARVEELRAKLAADGESHLEEALAAAAQASEFRALRVSYPTQRTLAELLYFTRCREIVGAQGLPRSRIYNALGIATGTMSGTIRGLDFSLDCPSCGSSGSAAGVRFNHEGLVAGTFTCAHCHHTETLPADRYALGRRAEISANAFSCSCAACAARRNDALTQVSAAAADLPTRLLSIISTLERNAFAGHDSTRVNEEWAMSYALLRSQGHVAEYAASMIWADGGWNDAKFWPEWLYGLEHNDLVKHSRHEKLPEQLATAFRWAVATRHCPGVTAESLQSEFQSMDVARVVSAARTTTSILKAERLSPERWLMSENTDRLRALAHEAESRHMTPKHIYASHARSMEWVEANRGKEWQTYQALSSVWDRILTGPAPEVPVAAPQPVPADEQAAIRLLQARGYKLTPPERG